MKNKPFLMPVLAGIVCFALHFTIGGYFFPRLIKLFIVIHVFLFIWSLIYMFTLRKIQVKFPKMVISGFMVLTTIKMLLSIVFLLILKNYLSTLTTTIIINFFIAFFIHLFLQVYYSIILLR